MEIAEETLEAPEIEIDRRYDPEASDVVGHIFRAAAQSDNYEKEEQKRYIRGKAEPGTIVYATWKSVVVTSVTIADASQGEFEIKVPDKLQEGEHEVIVFAYDPNKSLVGNISSLIFNK